jgi:hypothetical protein
MPIYLEISRLHRTASIFGRGYITADEIVGVIKQLLDAHVPAFAKLVDVSASTSDLTQDQIERLADLLRGDPQVVHGPVAFLVNPNREGFAHAYARGTQGKRPVRLFNNLQAARKWLMEVSAVASSAQRPVPAAQSVSPPWSDPQREGTVFRGDRSRDIQIR